MRRKKYRDENTANNVMIDNKDMFGDKKNDVQDALVWSDDDRTAEAARIEAGDEENAGQYVMGGSDENRLAEKISSKSEMMKRLQSETVEQSVDVPDPQMQEETVENRISDRVSDQIA